ncbi:hypothetical protein Dimus_036139 [Dionaea muscipula]
MKGRESPLEDEEDDDVAMVAMMNTWEGRTLTRGHLLRILGRREMEIGKVMEFHGTRDTRGTRGIDESCHEEGWIGKTYSRYTSQGVWWSGSDLDDGTRMWWIDGVEGGSRLCSSFTSVEGVIGVMPLVRMGTGEAFVAMRSLDKVGSVSHAILVCCDDRFVEEIKDDTSLDGSSGSSDGEEARLLASLDQLDFIRLIVVTEKMRLQPWSR